MELNVFILNFSVHCKERERDEKRNLIVSTDNNFSTMLKSEICVHIPNFIPFPVKVT